jgi:hypothetical protein
MASNDWEDARAEVTRKAVDALSGLKKRASLFVADHPEIEDSMSRVEAEARKRIKKILDRLG